MTDSPQGVNEGFLYAPLTCFCQGRWAVGENRNTDTDIPAQLAMDSCTKSSQSVKKRKSGYVLVLFTVRIS